MAELLQVFTLLCGIDYTGAEYLTCIEKSKVCIEKNLDVKQATKGKKPKRLLSDANKDVFYKCYAAGSVK